MSTNLNEKTHESATSGFQNRFKAPSKNALKKQKRSAEQACAQNFELEKIRQVLLAHRAKLRNLTYNVAVELVNATGLPYRKTLLKWLRLDWQNMSCYSEKVFWSSSQVVAAFVKLLSALSLDERNRMFDIALSYNMLKGGFRRAYIVTLLDEVHWKNLRVNISEKRYRSKWWPYLIRHRTWKAYIDTPKCTYRGVVTIPGSEIMIYYDPTDTRWDFPYQRPVAYKRHRVWSDDPDLVIPQSKLPKFHDPAVRIEPQMLKRAKEKVKDVKQTVTNVFDAAKDFGNIANAYTVIRDNVTSFIKNLFGTICNIGSILDKFIDIALNCFQIYLIGFDFKMCWPSLLALAKNFVQVIGEQHLQKLARGFFDLMVWILKVVSREKKIQYVPESSSPTPYDEEFLPMPEIDGDKLAQGMKQFEKDDQTVSTHPLEDKPPFVKKESLLKDLCMLPIDALCTVVGAFLSIFDETKEAFKYVGELAKRLKALSDVVTYGGKVINYVKDVIGSVLNAFSMKIFGKPLPFKVYQLQHDVSVYTAKFDKWFDIVNSKEHTFLEADVAEISQLMIDGVNIHVRLILEQPPNVALAFRTIMQQVTILYGKAWDNYSRAGSTRAEPVSIVFLGAPNVGKSYLIPEFHTALLQYIYNCEKREVNTQKDVYQKKIETGADCYFSGYLKQKIYHNDDIGIQKDMLGAPNLDYIYLMAFMGTLPCPLPQAAIGLKGLVCFESEYITATSNILWHETPSLASDEALNRRLEFKVFMRLKPQFSTDGRYDPSKTKGINEMPWTFHLIRKRTKTDDILSCEVSFQELVMRVYEARQAKVEAFKRAQKSEMSYYAKDWRVKNAKLPVLAFDNQADIRRAATNCTTHIPVTYQSKFSGLPNDYLPDLVDPAEFDDPIVDASMPPTRITPEARTMVRADVPCWVMGRKISLLSEMAGTFNGITYLKSKLGPKDHDVEPLAFVHVDGSPEYFKQTFNVFCRNDPDRMTNAEYNIALYNFLVYARRACIGDDDWEFKNSTTKLLFRDFKIDVREVVTDDVERLPWSTTFKKSIVYFLKVLATAIVCGVGTTILCGIMTVFSTCLMVWTLGKLYEYMTPKVDKQADGIYNHDPHVMRAKERIAPPKVVRQGQAFGSIFNDTLTQLGNNVVAVTVQVVPDTKFKLMCRGIMVGGNYILVQKHDTHNLPFMNAVAFHRRGVAAYWCKDPHRILIHDLSPGKHMDACLIEVPGMPHAPILGHRFVPQGAIEPLAKLKLAMVKAQALEEGKEIKCSFATGTLHHSYLELEPDKWFLVDSTIAYSGEYHAGDCGTGIIADNASIQACIVGIHVGSSAKGYGYGQIVTREQLAPYMDRVRYPIHLDAMKVTKQSAEITDEGNLVDKSPVGGNSILLGYVSDAKPGTNVSKIKPSAIAGKLVRNDEILEPIRFPANLGVHEGKDTAIAGLTKIAGTAPAFLERHRRAGLSAVFDQFHKKKMNVRRFLTLWEACHGVEGNEYIKGLNRKTALGYPEETWSVLPGKTEFLGKGDERFVHKA